MPDREKVIRGLECCARCANTDLWDMTMCAGCPYDCPIGCGHKLAADALALLREQEPRLLGLEEVKAIAIRETKRFLSTEVEPVWLERNEGGQTNLSLVLISWWYMEDIDEDETKFEFIAKFFGTDLDDTLNYRDYGTRWRVWSSKPTVEQRRAVKWDG